MVVKKVSGLVLILLIGSLAKVPKVSAFQLSPTGSNGCISQWFVSNGGTNPFSLLHRDPDGLPLSGLRFDEGYSDPENGLKGYLDFDQDGKSDIFSAVAAESGLYRWRFSSGGSGPWLDLSLDDTPPDQLRFGDFDGDGKTDVFASKPIPNSALLQWQYSPRGTGAFILLSSDSRPVDQLRFGDFDGDGKTDIFALADLGGGSFNWTVSTSGASAFVSINSASTLLADMQFADLDGDGRTDVFTTQPDTPGKYLWRYSSAGAGVYQDLLKTNLSVHQIWLAGDFNQDKLSDAFFATPYFDNFLQWWYETLLGNPSAVSLTTDSTPPDQLRFGDFNGDGVTDVLKLIRQCSVRLPLVVR